MDENRNWNLLFVDGEEVFRYFDEPVCQYRIDSLMYVFGADVPKINVNSEGVRSYKFTSNTKKHDTIGEPE